MMYVRLRNALSIWLTALAFLMMKSLYAPIHFGGADKATDAFCNILTHNQISDARIPSTRKERKIKEWQEPNV